MSAIVQCMYWLSHTQLGAWAVIEQIPGIRSVLQTSALLEIPHRFCYNEKAFTLFSPNYQ